MWVEAAPMIRPQALVTARPLRLQVTSALTGIPDPLIYPRWVSGLFNYQRTSFSTRSFERYCEHRGEVSMLELLHKPTKMIRHGWWFALRLMITDLREAQESLASRLLLPEDYDRRCTARYCATCHGGGYVRRARCRACPVSYRCGARQRGLGYVASDGVDFRSLNDFVQWACLGREVVASAELITWELVRRVNFERVVKERVDPDHHRVAWLPMDPEEWLPVPASRTFTSPASLDLVRGDPLLGERPQRPISYRVTQAARDQFELPLATLWRGKSPDPLDPLARLHDLGLALHDLRVDERGRWLAVIAYPTCV